MNDHWRALHPIIAVLGIWLLFGVFLAGAMIWEYLWKKKVRQGRAAFKQKAWENAACYKPFSIVNRGSQGTCFGVLIPEDEPLLQPGTKILVSLIQNALQVDLPFTVKHCETTIRVGGSEGVKRLPSVYVFVQEKVSEKVSLPT
jgi:hypothetical protein